MSLADKKNKINNNPDDDQTACVTNILLKFIAK